MLVYVVEDDPDISEIECYALKSNKYNVKPLFSAEELRKAMREEIPDLIVLDIMLPDDNGIAVVEKLRGSDKIKRMPIILVSAKSSEIEKVKGFEAGADDYLTKPFGVMEFNSRIKALIRRAGITENGFERQKRYLYAGNISIDEEKREVYCNKKLIVLTYKEFELLKYLIINRGIVLSRDRIMENVWGFDFQGESRTVDMHIKTLRAKLGSEKDIIKTVRNVGYKIV
jgi:two-component system alkaline phosphatase synthesis response regulator PhoP